MAEEMHSEQVWKKAIPEARDRLQSRVLVAVVGTLLVWMSIWIAIRVIHDIARIPAFLLTAGISLTFALVAWLLKAATPAGAVTGGLLCFVLLDGSSSNQHSFVRSGLTPLALLFVLTLAATRAGRLKKAAAGLAEGRRGRNAAQVIANLSVAALGVSYLGFGLVMGGFGSFESSRSTYEVPMMLMCLAALVEATADTVSSEIGQAFGGKPVMILSWRRVDTGTDGAVTLLGSAAGILSGVMVAAAGMWALRLPLNTAIVAFAAGICGLFFDSLLGATVERKGWIGNDLVNFTSTAFAAGIAALAYRLWVF